MSYIVSHVRVTYTGRSARHLVVRAKEHVNFESKSWKKAIKDHISKCIVCANSNDILNSFTVFRKCSSDYVAKIHEALLIKNV